MALNSTSQNVPKTLEQLLLHIVEEETIKSHVEVPFFSEHRSNALLALALGPQKTFSQIPSKDSST